MSKKELIRKSLTYTDHARERMRALGITETDIETIRDFGSTISQTGNKEIKRLGKKGKGIIGVFLKFDTYALVKTVIREGRF